MLPERPPGRLEHAELQTELADDGRGHQPLSGPGPPPGLGAFLSPSRIPRINPEKFPEKAPKVRKGLCCLGERALCLTVS